MPELAIVVVFVTVLAPIGQVGRYALRADTALHEAAPPPHLRKVFATG